MDIARAKRRENIAEYILYIWQLEDLLRALQFSPEAVYSQLIKPRSLDPEREHELLVWYMDIVNLLREEDKEANGHLDHTLHLIGDLQNLHSQLMVLPAGERYRMLFSALAPELPRLRETLGKKEISDIELAFRALYAVMLYRIKGTEAVGKVSADVLEVVSPVIAELAAVFREVETGKLDLFGEKDNSAIN